MTVPRYPDFEVRVTNEAVLELPSGDFNTFQRDAVGVRVRTEIAPSSPGRTPRIVTVLFVVANDEWRGLDGDRRHALESWQLDAGIKYRTATMS